MNALPNDVVLHQLLPFLTNTDAAALSHSSHFWCKLIRSLPHVWSRLRIITTWYGPYSHMWHKPYKAFLAHAMHIQRITFGGYGEYPCYTYLSATDLSIITQVCLSLTHFHVYLPATNVVITSSQLRNFLRTQRPLLSLAYPYKGLTLDEDEWSPWQHPVSHLHLHGPSPPMQRVRPCVLQRLNPLSITSVHLEDVVNLDLDYVLRHLYRVHTLRLTRCITHREWNAAELSCMWHRSLPRMRDLQIYGCNRVVRSMRPLISFLRTFSTSLQLQCLGGDVTDAAYMQLVSMLTCVECTRQRTADHTVVTLCPTCITLRDGVLPQLSALIQFHVSYITYANTT